MMQTNYTAWRVILSIFFCFIPVGAQTDQQDVWVNGISEPSAFDYRNYSKGEANILQQRWSLVEAENLTSKGNEWAGDYTIGDVGDVSMTILRWAPNSGFAFLSVYNCLPTITALNYGGIEFSTDVLQLRPEISTTHKNMNKGHGGHVGSRLAVKYLPVKWGDRHYLVPESRLSVFYDYVAGLGVYRPGAYGFLVDEGFLLKSEDQDKPVYGMPIAPPGYESLVKKPMNATIISIGRKYLKRVPDSENPWWNELITEVTVNVGRAHGAKRGMTLIILDSEEDELVEILGVDRHFSRGRVVRSVRKNPGEKLNEWDDGRGPEYPVIRTGWRLSTNPLNL